REQRISLMFGVPSMYAAILRLKDASADDFKQIYAMISGGEPLPQPVREGFKQKLNVNLLEGYALTETRPVISLNIPQENRPGNVGKAVPGGEFKFVEDEVWVRGPMVMKGYYNLPEETAAAITPDRFFKTGDLGRMDADGFIYITGRKKELIIVAGEK